MSNLEAERKRLQTGYGPRLSQAGALSRELDRASLQVKRRGRQLVSAGLLALVLASAAVLGRSQPFTRSLWEASLPIYEQILRHPFLTELVDGNLDREKFAFYMIQDAHYLREFARALSVTASKAPRQQWASLLNVHAADTLRYERQLHEAVFKEYGISPGQVSRTEVAPEAFAYTSYLVATAHQSSFAESLGALLPCYWIYWEVGKKLRKEGSKSPVYQKWIEAYSSPEYGEAVEAVLRILDQAALESPPEVRDRIRRNFLRSSRYEWMFWDSAYARRSWPPPLSP